MISPSIGRVVWFTPSKSDTQLHSDQKMAALVAYVHSDTCINLAVFDANGVAHSRCSVTLIQGEDVPELFAGNGYYAEWMPYQKGQAAKHDAEAKA